MGRGLMTGRWRQLDDLAAEDYRRTDPRFGGGNLARNIGVVEQLQALAETKGCSVAQLAVGWVLAQGEDIVPIPGTRRVRYLEQNLRAADVVLTQSDLDRLDRIAPRGVIAGDRAADMSFVNR
jgi:aryl-alcohol dehydrogenase-like predicted oxidoreductase